jgi:hypothetical protein
LTDKEKLLYLERLTTVIRECLITNADTKHALLIVANDTTEALSLFAINADEALLNPLVRAATHIVEVQTDTGADRILN